MSSSIELASNDLKINVLILYCYVCCDVTLFKKHTILAVVTNTINIVRLIETFVMERLLVCQKRQGQFGIALT